MKDTIEEDLSASTLRSVPAWIMHDILLIDYVIFTQEFSVFCHLSRLKSQVGLLQTARLTHEFCCVGTCVGSGVAFDYRDEVRERNVIVNSLTSYSCTV